MGFGTFIPSTNNSRRSPALFRQMYKSAKLTTGDALFLPILLIAIVIIFIPFAQSAYYSFTNYNGVNPDYRFVGLRNYHIVLRDPALASSLYFTVLYAIATTAIVTVLAIPLAVALNRNFLGRDLARAIFFFPAIPSVAILGFVWAFILSPLSTGALNALFDLMGAAPVPWLSNSQLARMSVIVVGVWTLTGWHAVLYLAYLQSIPADLYEAAKIDGASNIQSFLYVTVPLLKPATTVSVLLLLISGMNVYALPIALTRGGPGFSTFTITQSIISQGIAQGQYGQAAALSIIFMVIIAVLISIQMTIGADRKRVKA